MPKMLTSIIIPILKSIQQSIPNGTIFFVGSLANDEITAIRNNSNSKDTLASDIDIIISVDIPTFVRDRILSLSSKLAQALTYMLRSKGHKTHVSIATFSYKLHRIMPLFFFPNTIYQYEMARVVFDRNQYYIYPRRFHVTPSKSDCINLTFSAIIDYILISLELCPNLTTQQKCYIIAKRCLTLIYSLLLFEGKNPRGYMSTVKLAEKHFAELQDVLTQTDLKILKVLAEFKIQGQLRLLVEKLPTKEKTLDEAFLFLLNFFEELVKRVLLYELNCYFGFCTGNVKERHSSYYILLENYRLKSRMSVARCLTLSLIYVASLAVDRDFLKFKFRIYSILSKRLEISSYIRYLVGRLFLLLTTSDNKDKVKIRSLASYMMNLWNLFMM